MKTKILIAGGTGFVGRHLTRFLIENGYRVGILSRRNIASKNDINYYRWDIDKEYIDKKAFTDVDTIINLTGANIQKKRWTDKRKKEIVESRVKPLDLLYKYVSENNFPIKTIISTSAVGYYGAVTSQHIYSENDENGNDFLAAVCKQWESAARQFENSGARVIILRKGVILAKDGGFYKKLAPWAKLGINISLGNGKQYIPWIDMRDIVSLCDFLIKKSIVSGTFNAVATHQPTMNELAKAFLNHFNKKSFLPNVPAFLIKLIVGKKSSMVLKGSRVSNKKIRQLGFQYQYNRIENFFRYS